ncbi:MAG TPA: glycosyltransferase family 2 protein [Chloroflexota bacterium]|nr:glycosyltransferase family 2 protein [Chloroflexota bacterium]
MPIVSLISTALLSALIATQVVLLGYLLLLSATALLARPRGIPAATRIRRFAVLVPAHNEAGVITRVLASLGRLDYPPESVDVCVVADNCDDATAALARARGARVYERFDATDRAKGFALRWLIQQLETEGLTYDAYVVVDADSVLAENFLHAMNARLEGGAQAIQAYYSVLNPGRSSVAGLRYAALAAVHYLRPLGRAYFGLSAGLKGNGMCFTAAILKRFDWRWFTLAEDVEFHLALVEQGVVVRFAPETWVKADMPVTLRQAASQNARWETGRLQLIRRHVPRLLWLGMRGRSWVQLDAAAEQLIPPLSVPFALSAVAVGGALLVGNLGLAAIAAACVIGYVLYLLVALALVQAPFSIYLTLGMAPAYVVWKVALYARSLLSPRATAWVRTARTATPD